MYGLTRRIQVISEEDSEREIERVWGKRERDTKYFDLCSFSRFSSIANSITVGPNSFGLN